jgi:hypothetical protein
MLVVAAWPREVQVCGWWRMVTISHSALRFRTLGDIVTTLLHSCNDGTWLQSSNCNVALPHSYHYILFGTRLVYPCGGPSLAPVCVDVMIGGTGGVGGQEPTGGSSDINSTEGRRGGGGGLGRVTPFRFFCPGARAVWPVACGMTGSDHGFEWN